MIEDVRLKTSSTRPAARLPYLVASVILFNQWIVLNVWSGFGRHGQWQGITFTTEFQGSDARRETVRLHKIGRTAPDVAS